MAVQSYSIWRAKIAARLIARNGFEMSTAEKIADKVVNKVASTTGGGNWLESFTYGTSVERASKYSTLSDFFDALGNSSFKIGKSDLQKMIKKFKTRSAIETVNSFVKQYTQPQVISLRQRWDKYIGNPIVNSKKALQAQMVQNYRDIQQKTKTAVSTLRTKVLSAMTPWTILKSIFYLFGTAFSFITDNEAVIGTLPLGGMGIDSPTSVQYIEVAHSNKQVKFRAVGSIFLAHQIGGQDAIKISGKLTGDLRFYWLTALWILTLLSQGYLEVFDFDSDIVTLNESYDLNQFLRNGTGPVTPLAKVDNIVTEKPSYEKHITYPLITVHEIIPNCYIETFSFEEKVESNKDVITYDLLLRTYVEPEEFLADNEHTMYRQARQTKTEQVIKYSINFVYRMLKATKEYINIDSNSWKTDNYYNVDAADMGFVFGLALAGGL